MIMLKFMPNAKCLCVMLILISMSMPKSIPMPMPLSSPMPIPMSTPMSMPMLYLCL